MASAENTGSIPSVDLRADLRVDLRRRSHAGTGTGVPGARLYGAVLLVTAGCASVSLVAELGLSFTPHQLPAGSLSFFGGDSDSPAGWHVVDARADEGVVRDGDLISAIEGVPALDVLRSDSLRARFDELLRAGPLSATVVREPTYQRRDFTRWRILAYTAGRPGLRTRAVVLDSAQAGSGLEETLRAFDSSDPDVCGAPEPPCAAGRQVLGRLPPEMDLASAEAALVAFDPSLRRLPVDTELRLQLRGDDLALPVLGVGTTSGARLQLEQAEGDWVVIPAGTSTQSLVRVRRPWNESAEAVGVRVIFLLIAIVGLMSLRAQSASEAVRYFIVLCTLMSLGALTAAHDSWLRMWNPISTELVFGDQFVMYESSPDGSFRGGQVALLSQIIPILALITLAGGLVFHSVLRLLQTFPARDSRLVSRYGVPWRSLLVAAVLGVLAAALVERNIRSAELLWATRVGTGGAVALILGGLILLVQVVRLGVARMRQKYRGEEALQARLALSGLAIGAILLLWIWAFPSWYRASIPWTVGLYDAVEGARRVLTPLALAIPFLGFFLAIVRRGLWDVDLIVQRATLLSAMTGLFVVAWVLFEVTVEAFLSNSLAGVPVVGSLMPALLAGGLVAVSQRPVTDLVAKRFRPVGRSLGDVFEQLSAELEDAPDADALAARLVPRLRDLADASQCDLVLADARDGTWRRWSADGGGTGLVVVASALGALETSRHAIVTIDEGPVLLTKLNRTGPARGVLALGMRQGGSFYSTEDRQMMALFLGTLEHELAA